MGACDLFREQQDRQQFSDTPRRQTFDLYGHLLMPALDLPVADAARRADRRFTESVGPVVRNLPDLAALVPLLLRPAPEHAQFAGEVPDPDLEALEEQKRFTGRQWEQAIVLLNLPDEVRTLCGLLDEAATLDPGLPELVALLALHAYGPQTGTARYRQMKRGSVVVLRLTGGPATTAPPVRRTPPKGRVGGGGDGPGRTGPTSVAVRVQHGGRSRRGGGQHGRDGGDLTAGPGRPHRRDGEQQGHHAQSLQEGDP